MDRVETPTAVAERKGDITTVSTVGDKPWLVHDGCECLNPKDDPEKHIWQKTFRDKEIFFPHEYKEAMAKYLSQENQFVFSLNGYSSINKKHAQRYGVNNDTYVAACNSLYKNLIVHLKKEFPEVNLALIDGASDLGVDRAGQQVAEQTNEIIKELRIDMMEMVFL